MQSSATIVVVDDDQTVRRVVARQLERAGYGVLEASDGEDALRVMTEHHEPVDLVVSDISMPAMDGLELVELLRNAYPELPLLLISGQSAEFLMAQRDRIPDGVHFLAKPFEYEALTSRVASILS
ncbi:MAG TPA: response regulator [Gemmatimonadaceae bacterium]|nr:response regulator [Gemmatimonadaceae bacterium]